MHAPSSTVLVVRTASAEDLAEILRQLPMAQAHVVPGSWNQTERTCHVRVATEFNAGFVRFALPQQGYGEVIAEVHDTVGADSARADRP